MPGLSPKEYSELQNLITGPDHGLNPDELDRATKAIAEFHEQYETGMRGGISTEQAMAMGPPTQADPDVARETPDLSMKLDPNFSLIAQADATAPATTHPGGDQQAALDWMAGPPDGDITYVYEPPLNVVQQKYLENPELAKTLFPHAPPPPEEIAKMQKGDSLYEAYANRQWADTAKAAAESGKTVYRYSKAPWLHDGKMTHALSVLGGWANAAAPAFIMGVDNTGFFGAARAGFEATESPEKIEAQATADTNAPGAALAGQALGALMPWTATAKLWNFIGSGGAGIAAARAGKIGSGITARTLTSAGSASLAAGADQAAREGVGALSGDGFDLGESGARVGAAMNPLDNPLAPALGAAGELAGSVANKGAEWSRHRAYGGAIGEMEASGSKFRFGRPPTVSDDAEEMVRQGRAEGVVAQDPRAAELVPKVMAGAAKIRADKAIELGERNRPFYESREGRMLLPVSNVVDAAAKKLREQYAKRSSGRMDPIAAETGGADIEKFRNILNEQIVAVSVKPSKSAVAISPEEAQEFLSSSNRKSLMPKPPPKESSSGAREVDLSSAGATEEPAGLAGSLRARGVNKVYLIPRRLSAEDHETLIHKYNPKTEGTDPQTGRATTYVDRDKAEIQKAAYRDRDARPMNGEPGGWSSAQRQARQSLKDAENIQKRVGLTEDAALQNLSQYSRQSPGQVFNVRALRAAADQGGKGVREHLDNMRALDPWQRLQTAMTPGGTSGHGNLGYMGAARNAAHVGAVYPAMRGLEKPTGPIRGGTAGRFSLLAGNRLAMPDEDDEEKKR